jgi:nickel/cobalt exporter
MPARGRPKWNGAPRRNFPAGCAQRSAGAPVAAKPVRRRHCALALQQERGYRYALELALTTLPILLGLLLGIRHAADADHVATIAAVVVGRTTLLGALRTAVLWGVGHTLTFFAVGLGIVIFGLHIPPSFDVAVELLIATSLLLLGIQQLLRSSRNQTSTGPSHPARSIALGSMHGLAGSAAVALLALSTIGSRPHAVLYLALFGVGTVIGMAVITLLLAWSFRLSASLAWAQRLLIGSAGLASCLCGLLLFGELLV